MPLAAAGKQMKGSIPAGNLTKFKISIQYEKTNYTISNRLRYVGYDVGL